jgi:hypothetical protein
MNLDLYKLFTDSFSRQNGLNKLKADESKDLLMRSLYLLENIIIENNSNNLNATKRLYEDIKDFILNK